MPPLFDAYVMADWSAAAVPATGADSIWIAAAERDSEGALAPPRLVNPPTRQAAVAYLADHLSDLIARDRTVLAGFDFAFGYPAGFARMLRRDGSADWRVIWTELATRIRDAVDNANNRFSVAAALNRRASGGAFPFWGCPAAAAGPLLSARKPDGYGADLAEFRLCDLAGGGAQPVWKLAYPGSVGSQSLTGIPHLQALRRHPWLEDRVRLWPFETGLKPLARPGPGEGWRVLLAEIYPSLFDAAAIAHPVKDARQVHAVVDRLAGLDGEGRLAPLFAGPAELAAGQRRAVEQEEGWILGIDALAPPRRTAARRRYDYISDPDEIYRRSFATIRKEADLSAIPADLEPLVVRMIHAAGDPGIAADLAFSPGAAAAGRQALAAGAPVFVDADMVALGIIRARLPKDNAVLCTLREPGIAEAARQAATTRSAAAVERWRDRLAGAVVAIGNAPTALFRLLEMLDEGAPAPALILGMPVGFVGAAESKEALIAHPGGVPFITVRGRRGGSAFAAAAVNALSGPPA